MCFTREDGLECLLHHSGSSALLKGSLAVMGDALDLIPGGRQTPVASQLGLHLAASATCQPLSLLANQI